MKNANNLFKIQNEFISKMPKSAAGMISACIVLFLVNGLNENYLFYGRLTILLIVIINIFRFFLSRNYINNKKSFNLVINQMKVIVYLSILLWFVFVIIMLSAHSFILNDYILLTFLTMMTFSVFTTSSFFWDKKMIIFCTFMYMTPIIIYSIKATILDQNYNRLTLIILFVIYFLYNKKYASDLLSEINLRLDYAQDLKDSLEDLDRAHKALEQETFNKLQSSRLNSLIEFANGVAHEVNNPLTIIQITTKKFLEGDYGPISEIQTDKLSKLTQSINRIDKVVSSLKNVTSNISYDNFSENRLDYLLNSVLSIYLEKAALARVKIIVDSIPPVFVQCIAPQISQIIVGLIENAIEALESEVNKKIIYIYSYNFEKNIQLVISNEGPLIPKENIEKIFLPFFTTKKLGQGPGLGLSLARSLTIGNGGTLEYAVINGKVSFVLTLSKSKL